MSTLNCRPLGFALALALCGGTGPWAAGQDPPKVDLKLPAEIKAAPGAVVKIQAETAAKKVRWRSLDPGFTLLDRDDLRDHRAMRGFACRAGRYRVAAWCAAGDDATDQVECLIVVEGPSPTPDPLAAALLGLYDSETAADKKESLKLLAAVWREAVTYAVSPQDATVGALLARIREASARLLGGPDKLRSLRLRISEELKTTLPAVAEAPLDETTRGKAGALFARIATALEGLARK